jgi:preprotein translocase subunit SecG
MSFLESAVLVLHTLAAISLCGFVLLQHGKGADMGAAFGGGSSGSLFGSAGSANFLSRTTAALATIFFVSSVALTYFGSLHGKPQGVMEKGLMEQVVPAPKPSDVPQPSGGAATPAQPMNAVPAPKAPAAPVTPAESGNAKGANEVPK